MILNFQKIKNHREKKDPRTIKKDPDIKSNYNIYVFKFSFETKTGSQKTACIVSYRDTTGRGDTGVQNSQFPFWLIFSLIPICFTFLSNSPKNSWQKFCCLLFISSFPILKHFGPLFQQTLSPHSLHSIKSQIPVEYSKHWNRNNN